MTGDGCNFDVNAEAFAVAAMVLGVSLGVLPTG